MSSFISRSAVLAFARLMNMALALIGPLLLVRLLQITEYGQYRQFTVTAMFVLALASFAVSSNLNYLIARSPERAAASVSNACLIMLATAIAGALAVVAGHGLFVPDEIAATWPWLALYVLLALNLEVPVSYWLAYGRSDRVLAYTLTVTALRLGGVTGAAWYFGDVRMIFVTMVCVEALRALGVYLWLRARGLLVFRWEGAALREQVKLVTPLGAGSVLWRLNDHVGKVVVGNSFGPAPLAIYTTAAYQVPVVGIVQQTLVDVVFPDMVKRSKNDPLQGLRLWKRANVLTFSAIFPAWALLTWFAEPLIRLLFTEAYVAATPYFQVFLLLMLRQCFHFSTPLRCVEDNASFARANAASLAVNVALIVTLMPKFGLWGPTLGLVVGQSLVPFYLGYKVMKRFDIPLAQLCEWRRLAVAVLATALAFAVLYGSQLIWPHTLAGVALGLGLFGAVYALCARFFLRQEYQYVLREFSRRRRNACQSA